MFYNRKMIVEFALSHVLPFVLSPTYYYAKRKKHAIRDREIHLDQQKIQVGNFIRGRNTGYLWGAFLLAVLVCIIDPSREIYPTSPLAYWFLVLGFCWLFAFSRPNEIFYAFYRDAIDKVDDKRPFSNLKFGERIKLALKSYLELILNFATMYYLFPAAWFKQEFDFYFQALYFSGVTITTLGYGDIAPVCIVPQLLTVYEVLCGFILLIVSFAIYTGRGIGRLNN